MSTSDFANIIKTLKICKIYNIFSNVILFGITRYGGSEHFIAKSSPWSEYFMGVNT